MYITNERKSTVQINKLYFWTATINNWYRLFEENILKDVIISSLKHLFKHKKVEVYAFVIMPNHVHFIWQITEMNGKEMPHISFLKYTAHVFREHLKLHNPKFLKLFKVDAINKEYEFWKRDSLAFELFKKETILQKLDYINNNPIAEHWKLCNEPADYHYSSAKFYETGLDEFGFLINISTLL